MRCEEVRELLDLHLDRELAEEMSRKLERHLLRCPACSHEARTLEQTQRMLREAVTAEEPAPGFRERTAARLQDALLTTLSPAPSRERGRQWALPLLSGE